MRMRARSALLCVAVAGATAAICAPAQAHTARQYRWSHMTLTETIAAQKTLVVADWKVISAWQSRQAKAIRAGALWTPEPVIVRWHIAHMKWTQRELRESLKRQERLRARRLAEARRRVLASYGGNGNVALGAKMAAAYGWTGGEWQALYRLWNNESGWSTSAHNPYSDACGIPQAMNNCAYGYSPAAQIAWGLAYVKRTYGSPSAALGHWYATNWY